ncbi:MAG: tetratricopeptide repeat protein [Pseudomonadota bacterium]
MARDLDALIRSGDWQRAETRLRRLARERDATAPVFYNLAKVLEAQGKWAQSGAWLKRAVSADVKHGKAWFELGRWLVDQGGAVSEAAAAFGRAAKLLPDDVDSWRNLARTTLRAGQWARALEASEKVLTLLPEEAEALAIAARAAAEERDRARAADYAKRLAVRGDSGALWLKALTRSSAGSLPLRPPRY